MNNNIYYHEIFKRKSVRDFILEPLPDELLKEVLVVQNKLISLDSNQKLEARIVDSNSVKGLFNVKAPHYLALYSPNNKEALLNLGFVYQQWCIYLSTINLGTCWLGAAKTTQTIAGLNNSILIAFGKSKTSVHRNSGYKRKNISEISINSSNLIEAARVAPSAINNQPWYFVCHGQVIDCYCAKYGTIKSKLYQNTIMIDCGITLAHILFASYYHNLIFNFTIRTDIKKIEGYQYIGSVENG